jgi:ribosome-binding factor A
MTHYSRAERVGGLIQKTLSEVLLRSVKDPRLARTTITHVKVTRDLKIARIYFTVPPGAENINQALQGFKSALGFIKRNLAGELGLRYMPEIEFFYDDSLDTGARIEQLLKSIHKNS